MNVNKVHLCCNLMKFRPCYCFKKISCNQILLRNFTLGSNLCDVPDNKNSELFTGVERIQTLQSISRKHNKLSTVEEKDIPLVEDLKKGNVFHPYKGPGDRIKKVLAEDAKITFRKLFKFLTMVELGKLEHEYFNKYTDTLIIGAGVTGLLIANALRSQFPHGPEVMVIDKFESLPRPSINLGQGLVTQQLFSEEEEIPMLQYGIEFFSSFTRQTRMDNKPEFKLPYDPMGSLILANTKNADQVLRNTDILKSHRIQNKILNRATLQEKFPWLNLDDVLFGSLGMQCEGTIDPWTFIYALKCKAINLGVHFQTAEVVDFGFDNCDIRRAICKLPDGTYNSVDFAFCVIAAGIESLNLVNLFNTSQEFNLGLKLPLEERMRYEYCFYSPEGPGVNTPIVVDSDGTYFRREGLTGHYITGVPAIVNSDDGENSPYYVFENTIRPFLTKRMSHLNKFDLVKGWIDVYEYCFSNRIGITGPHPETDRIIFAIGFSHFGLLLLPALARGVMEYIYYDYYQTIDFKPFHVENLWKKQHLEADRRRRELLEAEKRIPLPNPLSENNKVEVNSG